MRARRIIEGAAFGPEVLDVAKRAFDAAWAAVADKFAEREQEEARAALAQAVIMATREDSNDPAPIREVALRSLTLSYPSRFHARQKGSGSKTGS